MEILEAVGDEALPDWAVGSGVIRNIVWDHLHNYSEPTPVSDVDVVFFDPDDTSGERDAEVERRLRARLPGVPWEVKNQAGVHLWYEAKFGHPFPPAQSLADAISRWPETATSVAVRLHADGARGSGRRSASTTCSRRSCAVIRAR